MDRRKTFHNDISIILLQLYHCNNFKRPKNWEQAIFNKGTTQNVIYLLYFGLENVNPAFTVFEQLSVREFQMPGEKFVI